MFLRRHEARMPKFRPFCDNYFFHPIHHIAIFLRSPLQLLCGQLTENMRNKVPNDNLAIYSILLSDDSQETGKVKNNELDPQITLFHK